MHSTWPFDFQPGFAPLFVIPNANLLFRRSYTRGAGCPLLPSATPAARRRRSPVNRLPQYGYAILAAALFVLGFYVWGVRSVRARKAWPTAQGTVRQSAVVRTTRAYYMTPTVNRTNNDGYYENRPIWELDVRIDFQVNGVAYTCTRATPMDEVDLVADSPHGPSSRMQAWQAQLPVGAVLPVHYDPADPQESYALYSESPQIRSALNISLVLLLIGLALIAAPHVLGRTPR